MEWVWLGLGLIREGYDWAELVEMTKENDVALIALYHAPYSSSIASAAVAMRKHTTNHGSYNINMNCNGKSDSKSNSKNNSYSSNNSNSNSNNSRKSDSKSNSKLTVTSAEQQKQKRLGRSRQFGQDFFPTRFPLSRYHKLVPNCTL